MSEFNKAKTEQIMNLMMQRLNIPLSSENATPTQIMEMLFVRELNQFMGLGIILCGAEERLFEIIRAYLDMLELALKESK